MAWVGTAWSPDRLPGLRATASAYYRLAGGQPVRTPAFPLSWLLRSVERRRRRELAVCQRTAPTFVAIVGHADDDDLLDRCIEHHLSIGFDGVFVSYNLDEASALVRQSAWAQEPRVRIEHITEMGSNTWRFFTDATRRVIDWVDPDWVCYVDTDEFWVPAEGRIQAVDVQDFDLAFVERRDAVARRGASVPLDRLLDVPTSTDPARRDEKVLIRPRLVAEVGRGGHFCWTLLRGVRVRQPRSDLLILHFELTTLRRLQGKASRVRQRLAEYGSQFPGHEPTHWRELVDVAESGGLEDLLEQRSMSDDQISTALESGLVTTPRALLSSV